MCSLPPTHAHEDLLAVQPHGIAAQARARRVHPAARPHVERPLVGGAGEQGTVEDALGERVGQVRAPILVGEDLPVDIAQQDVDGPEVHGLHLTLPDVVQRARIPPVRHGGQLRSTVKMSPAPSPAWAMVEVGPRTSPRSLRTVTGPSRSGTKLQATSWAASCATVRSSGVTITRIKKSPLA